MENGINPGANPGRSIIKMLIFHENLPEEADEAAKVINSVYGIESIIKTVDLDNAFVPIPQFDGYLNSSPGVLSALSELKSEDYKTAGKATLVLTQRDLYLKGNSKEDDWIFGYNIEGVSVLSNARIKREDSQKSRTIEVSKELYFKRLSFLVVHEIGHDVIKRSHMQQATWVSSNSYELELGPHCTDNTCVMYEVIDIKCDKDKGYMRLGNEKKFDAGLDETIARLRADYLCSVCRNSISIDNSYRLVKK